jgi:hypothetical protein
VGRRPLKPDEPDLLEEMKDYVFYPVIVPTPEQASTGGSSDSTLPEQTAAGGSSASTLPGQIAVGGSSVLPPLAYTTAGGSSSVLPPPAQSVVGGSSGLKEKAPVVLVRSSLSPQAGSPADPSKKRPAEGGSGIGLLEDLREGVFSGP